MNIKPNPKFNMYDFISFHYTSEYSGIVNRFIYSDKEETYLYSCYIVKNNRIVDEIERYEIAEKYLSINDKEKPDRIKAMIMINIWRNK